MGHKNNPDKIRVILGALGIGTSENLFNAVN